MSQNKFQPMFELGKETSNEWCEGVTDEEYQAL